MSDTMRRLRRPIERYGFADAAEGRRQRGRRIAEALVEFGEVEIARATILDIGCSTGLMTEEIAQRAGAVIGVDLDVESLVFAMHHARRARFVAGSGERLPFGNATFDAVVCNHVYEHVPSAVRLMGEVHRVLRAGGACYFAGGHTLQLIEPHYRLPLLSWLPRSMASMLLRATGRGAGYDERFLPPWRLPRLFESFAQAAFISPRMLAEPDRFEFDRIARWPSPIRSLLARFSGAVARLAPTWIYMLRK